MRNSGRKCHYFEGKMPLLRRAFEEEVFFTLVYPVGDLEPSPVILKSPYRGDGNMTGMEDSEGGRPLKHQSLFAFGFQNDVQAYSLLEQF